MEGPGSDAVAKIAGNIVASSDAGRSMKAWREKLAIRQITLARALGISPSVLSDYESGRRPSPGVQFVRKYNRVYGLTTGQFTPTSPYGYRGHSTPRGDKEVPLNPMKLMLASGASFIGRGYSGRREELRRLIREAILHRGFSFVDILQICSTYNDLTAYYNERVYAWSEEDAGDRQAAERRAGEWNYSDDAKIGLGVMYRKSAPTFEDAYPVPETMGPDERARWVAWIISERS